MRARIAPSCFLLLCLTLVPCFLAGCSGGGSNSSSSTGNGTASSTISVTASASSIISGNSVTFTATVSPSAATGTVTFYQVSTNLGTSTLSSGHASFKATFNSDGNYSVFAIYNGSSTYASSTSLAVSVSVTSTLDSTTTSLSSSSLTPTAGFPFQLTANVSPSAATGTVIFYQGSSVLGRAILNSGVATVSSSIAVAGTYSLTADYQGSSSYAASTSSVVSITVDAATASAESAADVDCGYPDSANSTYATAAHAFTRGVSTLSNPSLSVSGSNESAICAQNSGTSVAVTNPTIVSSSAGTNSSDSRFVGTNAAVLAYGSGAGSASGASINIVGGSIATKGQYGNGAFASGKGASLTLNGTAIDTSGANAHAVDAAEGGSLILTNVTASTSGPNSSVVATDSGGGTVTVNGGTFVSSGQHSPAIYSAGVFIVSGGNFTTNGAEAVVIEGGNSVNLSNAALIGSLGDHRGIFLFQSSSADASSGHASFAMTNGSIKYSCPVTASSTACYGGSVSTGQNNPATLFSIANTTATILLTDVRVDNDTSTPASAHGTLLTAAALNSGTWGNAGSNGGNVSFTARGTALAGDVIVDDISTAAISLLEDTSDTGSSLVGAINNAGTGKTVTLTLDAASSWTVTETSYLTRLSGLQINGSAVSNIKGGGHCVYYSGMVNGSSSGTYVLAGPGGGYLAPLGAVNLSCH